MVTHVDLERPSARREPDFLAAALRSRALHRGFVGAPGDYALRFLGDLRGDASFLELISNTTIDGRSAFYRFDGTFTDLVIPEPSSVTLMFLGLAIRSLTERPLVPAE